VVWTPIKVARCKVSPDSSAASHISFPFVSPLNVAARRLATVDGDRTVVAAPVLAMTLFLCYAECGDHQREAQAARKAASALREGPALEAARAAFVRRCAEALHRRPIRDPSALLCGLLSEPPTAASQLSIPTIAVDMRAMGLTDGQEPSAGTGEMLSDAESEDLFDVFERSSNLYVSVALGSMTCEQRADPR
jgi:hypothetical protein